MIARRFLPAVALGCTLFATAFGRDELPIERTRQPRTNGAVTLIYSTTRGTVSIDFGGTPCRMIEITSKRGLWRGERPQALPKSPFNVWNPRKFFILQQEGIRSLHLGPGLPAGESFDTLRKDLTVKGDRIERVYLLVVGTPLA